MANKNRYYSRSKISEAKFRQLVRCFALDFTAMSTAELTGISVRIVNHYGGIGVVGNAYCLLD